MTATEIVKSQDRELVNARDDKQLVKVLDLDASLLAAVPADKRGAARDALVATTVHVEVGPWDGEGLGEADALGLLALGGLLTRNVEIAGTHSREILGTGDIVRPWDEDSALDPVPSHTTWTVLEPTRLALLDRRWVLMAARWPELGDEILHRVMRGSRWLAVLLAIANLRGVESRVLLLLWHLAGNWGRVTPSGTLVPFGLTHEVIASLVGARRPSVTTALAAMERDGKLQRVEEGWLLHADPPTSGG